MAGLRERKKADTRRALSDAALALALEHGVDAVTREAVANVAGVSLRTFNNYFAGKYEALAHRVTERMQRGSAALRERPADEPLWAAITEATVATLEQDLARGDPPERRTDRTELAEVRKLLLSPDVRGAVPAAVHDDWVRAIAERTGTDPAVDMYPRLVAAVVRAVGDTAMEVYAGSNAPVSLPDLMRAGLAAVAAGLPEPPAERRD